MRQAGYLAAAGIYALNNNIDRLKKDHDQAKQIAGALEKKDFVREIMPVETNIVIFHLDEKYPAQKLLAQLKEQNILGHAIAPFSVRLVTHLDITEEMAQKTIDTIEKL